MDENAIIRKEGWVQVDAGRQQKEAPELLSIVGLFLFFRKHLQLVLTCVFVCCLIAFVQTVRSPKLYRSSARLAFLKDNNISQTITGQFEAPDYEDYSVALQTQLKIIRSKNIALQVVRKLDLDQNPAFYPLEKNKPYSSLTDVEIAKRQSEVADYLENSVQAEAGKNTRIVEVSVIHHDPQIAAQVANTLVDTYIDDSIRERYESSTKAADILRTQLSDLQAKVERSQEQMVEFQKQHGIVGADEKTNVITSKLDDLNHDLTAAQADRMQKEAEYRTLMGVDADKTTAMATDSLLLQLRLQHADAKTEYAQLQVKFGPQYPDVLRAANRITELETAIQGEVERVRAKSSEDYHAAQQRESMLRSAFDAQKNEANKLNDASIEFSILKHEADSNRELYDSLLTKMKEAGVSAMLSSSNVRVVDRAEPADEPFSPHASTNFSLALFAAFLIAGAVIAIREGMNPNLRDPSHVEAVSALPSLAMIPLDRHNAKGKFKVSINEKGLPRPKSPVTMTKPRSDVSEAYRALATSILLSPNRVQAFICTSALPEEGKTTTIVNLAVVLAQQGSRVLLVDADLRKPSIGKAFGIEGERGLADALQENDPFQYALPHPSLPTLHIMTSGDQPFSSAELLGSKVMGALLAEWREKYDYILLDSPPILPVTDAVRLSAHVDSVLLVIRSGKTTREMLLRARNLLLQVNAKVMGVVINAIDLTNQGYYGSYSYKNSYKYYHDDGNTTARVKSEPAPPQDSSEERLTIRVQ